MTVPELISHPWHLGDAWALWWVTLCASPLAVGGAMTIMPELHRQLVGGHAWLGETQFSGAVTLAQAAPGPNVLYVSLVGWAIGLNGLPPQPGLLDWLAGPVAALLIAVSGVLLPSSLLACAAAVGLRRHAAHPLVQSFKEGMAPVVVATMLSTAWLLGASHGLGRGTPGLVALALLATVLVTVTRLHLLWLLGAGALAGALGWV